jgi:hypothetical protein
VRWSPRTGIIARALAGLVLALAITYLASTLVSQPIGLASEPATMGESLAPTTQSRPSGTTTPTTRTITVTTPVAPPPVVTTGTPPTTPTTTGDGDDAGSFAAPSGRGDSDDD